MQQIDLARSAFLFLPLVLLGLLVLPGRATMRMVLAIAVGAIAAFVLPLILDRGTLTYLVSFSTMAGIYAMLSLGLNSQWGLAGHVNFGIAGFFSVGALGVRERLQPIQTLLDTVLAHRITLAPARFEVRLLLRGQAMLGAQPGKNSLVVVGGS